MEVRLMVPLVLSGGSGTRLWPVSRSDWPKQHSQLFSESLQCLTLRRASRLGRPWLITGQNLKVLSQTALKREGHELEGAIYEPQPKNTAAAVAVFCRYMELKSRSTDVVGVFPADQLIKNEDLFFQVCREAEVLAKDNYIVTLGVSPSAPATGYGYIQTKSPEINKDPILKAYEVERFHEKPNLETAKKFLKAGNYHWNAGIFIFNVERMLRAFTEFQPKIATVLNQWHGDLRDLSRVYENLESISIDYAIMEKLPPGSLACIPAEFGWSDVGSWDAVAEQYLSLGSSHVTKKSVIEIQSQDNFVFANNDKKVALVGVDQLIVVDTPDALLITQKGQTQEVKKVVEQLQKDEPELARSHGFEVRPWGEFEVLRDQPQFKSKVLTLHPHSQISYQSHKHREEHWIITQGQGEVVLNDETISVKPGSYVFIPLGAKHRIRNTSDGVLQFVEVQLGKYFGEDDIVRYQDDYDRVP